jgi:uncharacterized phage protein (TIGR01671 family)
MREIKFRGKRIDNGEWVYGFVFVSQMSGVFIIGSKMETKVTRDGGVLRDKLWQYEVAPSTVGQYIGLKDKNGKEIYEGDILRLWGGKDQNGELRREYTYPLPVIYSDLWCQFVVEDKANKVQYGIWQTFAALGVIGNIHDNPELLGDTP